MIMAGFEGKEISPALETLIREDNIGAVILFRRNIESMKQLARLVEGIKELAGDPNFIVAIDHEGGRVFRMPPPFTQMGPASLLGDNYRRDRSSSRAYETGRLMAKELSSVGINLNFAPVLDVNTNPDNPIIGDRSIDTDPAIVAKLGVEWIRGLTDGNVLSCGKHFPGHGDTSIDSHLGLPVLHHTMQRLEEVELIPFRAAIEANVPSIMTAHIIYGSLDSTLPVTLSKSIVTGILRRHLRYDGVVFTDDMLMKAISDHFTVEKAMLISFQAGCDMAIISREYETQRKTLAFLRDAVKNGDLPESMVGESLRRLKKMRDRLTASGQ